MEKFITGIITALVVFLLGGLLVWLTWNPMMTKMFGLKPIDYWDSVTLIILTGALFGRPQYTIKDDK